jgi:hypothetical protein
MPLAERAGALYVGPACNFALCGRDQNVSHLMVFVREVASLLAR